MSKFHILKGQRVIATADTLAEAQAFAKKSGARVLQVAAAVRKNPSPAEHADFAQSDLRLAREAIAIAKRQTNTTDRRDKAKDAIADAKLAKREAKHSGRADLQSQAAAAEDAAYEALIGQQYRQNGGRGPDVSRHSGALHDIAASVGTRKNPRPKSVAGTWSDSRLVDAESGKPKRIASIGGIVVAGWTGPKSTDLEFEAAVRSLIAHKQPNLHRPNIVDIEAAK